MAEYKKGDAVTVWSGGMESRPITLTTVAKVGAKKITLADGSAWTVRNTPWGGGADRLAPRSRYDAVKKLRHERIARIGHLDVERLDDQALEILDEVVARWRVRDAVRTTAIDAAIAAAMPMGVAMPWYQVHPAYPAELLPVLPREEADALARVATKDGRSWRRKPTNEAP